MLVKCENMKCVAGSVRNTGIQQLELPFSSFRGRFVAGSSRSIDRDSCSSRCRCEAGAGFSGVSISSGDRSSGDRSSD